MQIELSVEVEEALKRRAAGEGLTSSTYVKELVENHLLKSGHAAAKRTAAVDRMIEHMKNSTSASGRDGRPWREWIHEGHRY